MIVTKIKEIFSIFHKRDSLEKKKKFRSSYTDVQSHNLCEYDCVGNSSPSSKVHFMILVNSACGFCLLNTFGCFFLFI